MSLILDRFQGSNSRKLSVLIHLSQEAISIYRDTWGPFY